MIFCSVLTEEACSRASEDFLNFLADCGYKASREKAQLCQQSVRYLGLIISEGTRAIGPERIKPILNHPLPMTLRQLRGFLGITGYCRIWIPGYGELARPLYKLIAETQQAQTDKLVWSPETQKAFKVLQTALLQAPALSLPTGSEFNLFVTEKKAREDLKDKLLGLWSTPLFVSGRLPVVDIPTPKKRLSPSL
ncbi:uncharacterized protein LOC129629878 [Bubalus kerabau]|uniref:uncharacterized protein LOC129629878 n=1 Tax=Bubalus carabanensis TaxID=3119969 RepID=UPI00244ECD32|nr:uncharacterized protein LOC129629878 [Bubalus carabanensis]